jgi:hypothetical protein
MMTTYTRRGPGQSYLKGVLADRINSLIEHKDLNLEINPLKVSGVCAAPGFPRPDIVSGSVLVVYTLLFPLACAAIVSTPQHALTHRSTNK